MTPVTSTSAGGGMTVREFKDRAGRLWRAWNINPDAIHPVTRSEDYLADCFQLGWIVFETPDGAQKRRLCPYPIRWAEMPDRELNVLLDEAKAVPPSKLVLERSSATEILAEPAPQRRAGDEAGEPPIVDDSADVTDLRVVRSFRYPGGRLWSVYVVAHPEDGRDPVLRFAAGARYLDLRSWPREWPDFTDERLVGLLRHTGRRRPGQPNPDAPRRRYDDPPIH